ncbi:MAG: dipeptidase [Saprospiraceae bacterium]|jgi:membrane dipeptidase|nr:dipeptidase [Saprospiraceae bacterium]MBL0025049.1 dipeptidase [Saprospiraceae bacterium]
MKIVLFLSFISVFGLHSQDIQRDAKLMDQAKKLSQKFIITDGHVDLPFRLKITNFRMEKEYLGIPYQTSTGDFDFVRAREGGLDAPFMSIYIPAKTQEEGGAKQLADSLINIVEYIANGQPDYFNIAHTPKDVESAKKKGKIALPMGMENGAPVENDLRLISYFRKRGISYITLTHSKDNKICDSSYDTTRTWKGLSPYGFKVLDEMQKTGIMIDISHVSDSTFYQTVRYVKVPVIASHSSCRKFTPGFERNMSDDMIKVMKKNGGVIMVNFGSTFLDGNIAKYNDSLRNIYTTELAEKGIKEGSDEAKLFSDTFQKNNPKLYSDVEKVADHIDNIVSLAGIDHVGIGSDFDGVGDSLPVGLKDVSDYPNLIYVLLKRGYSDKDIKKICSGNLFRVWNKVLKSAGR